MTGPAGPRPLDVAALDCALELTAIRMQRATTGRQLRRAWEERLELYERRRLLGAPATREVAMP